MKWKKQERELTDNYAHFIEQLNTASKNLHARQDSLGMTLQIAGVLFKQNELGLKLWEERRTALEELLSQQVLPLKKADSLRELYEVANQMESTFKLRTQRIREKQFAVAANFDEIDKSLVELDRSKIKLHTSRMQSRDHEYLNKVVADLSGTVQLAAPSSTDPSLREDLNDAKRAIKLAEALLELKEK
ncbi:hypothetical protein FDW83_14575 [Pseudarthrobacter sp. NamE2]|uniref:hypothetical protein n=1 Tax=Pseudarthrobacter sp. NamE2 TaxID=2576838 RepID=UPI0010FE2D8C|nr:hypothetical protein [Pseudarthrobacter sp. NamE2]TLM81952.1 hypothetical protein FDW83_14575 [Pseudarthrobacter sp. NamE2]